MKTIIYIDGLNFYYGCTKGTPYKWVDLKELSQTVLGKKNIITKINLFAAIVKPTPKDPNVHLRQTTYFQALKAYIPEFELHLGHFLEHKVRMPLANPRKGTDHFPEVIKREEKGSDVNLAVHFLNDAWLNNYECGVIISNDSDLVEAVKLVRKQTRKIIGIISPFPQISKELKEYSHFQRKIRGNALKQCQLPDQIPGTKLKKPDAWQ